MSSGIKNLFDTISPKYDFLNHFLSAGRDIAWRRKASAGVASKHCKAVLDLCGGTGDFLEAFQKSGQPVTRPVVGDFSPGMLKQCREKFKSFYACQLDALHPPFGEDTFDAVLCGFGMRNLDSLEGGVQSVHRILKPGGVFVTLEFFRPEGAVPLGFYYGVAPLLIPFFGWVFSGNKDAYHYLVRSIREFHSVGEYRELLQANGFGSVRMLACDFGLAHIVVGEKA